MSFWQNPMLLSLLVMAFLSVLLIVRQWRWAGFCLLALTVMLFGLPRAGFILQRIPLSLPLAHILVMIIILDWLLLRRRKRLYHWGFTRYFYFYALVAGFGLAFGILRGGNLLIALLELAFYLFSMGLFFYAINTFYTRRHFIIFSRLLLALGLAVSIYGIAQKFLGRALLIPYITYTSGGKDISTINDFLLQSRVLSSYGDPNVLACQLVLFAGIALALVVGKKLSVWARLLGLVILCATTLCVFFTGSRAGMLCLFIIPIMVLYWRSRRVLLFIPVLALLGILFLPSLSGSALFNQMSELGPQMNLDPSDLRMQFPKTILHLFQAVPFGCGWGRTVEFETVGLHWYYLLIPAEVIWMGFNSFWLNLFSRLGIPGIITFGLILVVVFRYIWQRAQWVQDNWIQAFMIGSLAGMVGQWVIWMVNNTYMLPGGGLNFWFMFGMLVAGSRAFTEPEYPMRLGHPPWFSQTSREIDINQPPDETKEN